MHNITPNAVRCQGVTFRHPQVAQAGVPYGHPMDTFANWLEAQMRRRGWSAAELSRRSRLPKATVSRILNRKRAAGERAIKALARGLELPPEMVFRAAGVLPGEPKSDPLTEEGLHILHKLDGEDRVDALRYLRMRLEVSEGKRERAGRHLKGGA